MKKATFIIGNGMDLALGMKTKYIHFYEELIHPFSSNEYIYRLQNNVFKAIADARANDHFPNLEMWNDFEVELGKCSELYNKGEIHGYLQAFSYAARLLNDYLKKECEKYDWEATTTIDNNINARKFVNSLVNFDEALDNDGFRINLKLSFEKERNIISLNYTNTLKELLNTAAVRDIKLPSIKTTYLHGEIDNYLTVGVGDIADIKNTDFHSDPRIGSLVVKNNYRRLVDGQDIDDEDSRYLDAKNQLDESDIVAIFGTSLGESDAHLWNMVLDWFFTDKSNKLIIFIYDEELSKTGIVHKVDPLDVYAEKVEKRNKHRGIIEEHNKKIFANSRCTGDKSVSLCAKEHCINTESPRSCINDERPCKKKLENYKVQINAKLFDFALEEKTP